jgi:DNA-binding beta-propeller fold protein YncE
MKKRRVLLFPKNAIVLLVLAVLTACATAIPSVYLQRADLTMELGRPVFGIASVAVSKDGSRVLTGDNGGALVNGRAALVLWDMARGRQVWRADAGMGMVLSVAISPDGKYAIAGGLPSSGPPAAIFDMATGKRIMTVRGFFREVNWVDFSPDGRYFVVNHQAGEFIPQANISLYDTATGRFVRAFNPDYGTSIFSLKRTVTAFSPDGKYLLSGGFDAVLRLWNVETGEQLKIIKGHKQGMDGGVNGIAFSPDGKYAVTTAYNDGSVRIWNMPDGTEAGTFSGFESTFLQYAWGVSYAPDGRSVFILGRPLGLWDVATKQMTIPVRLNLDRAAHMMTRNPTAGAFNPDGRTFLFTPNDAAMRIFSAVNGETTAMMVGFDDGEWIIITSEGYYNASENGARYLTVKAGEQSYPVERFYDVFYRPDIVMAALQGRETSTFVTVTLKEAIENPPPVVEIMPPAEAGSAAKVCYQVTSAGGGIGEVRLFHNGKLIQSDGYYRDMARSGDGKQQILALNSSAIYENMRSVAVKGRTGATPLVSRTKGELVKDCREIEAIPGENEVSIAAFNGSNTVQSHLRTVRFVSQAPAAEPHLYILSIGIDRYLDKGISLVYAAKDASDIEQKLLTQSGTVYQPQNIHYELLTDAKAGKAGILGRIDELSRKIKPNDGFILFVAGHGVLLQNQYYMLTADFDGTVNESNMISSNEIVEMSKKIKSLSQLFIFDTCHAGGVDAIVSGLYDARMSVLAKKMGLHIYASASSLQQALDGYQGNGLFTHTLLAGLNNNSNADRNRDRSVSLVELGEFTKTATVDLSKQIGHPQTPLIINFGKDNPVYQLR